MPSEAVSKKIIKLPYLQAVNALWVVGYQVNLTPLEIPLQDDGSIRPHLTIANKQRATYFVEVERDADKNLESRQAKRRYFN